MGDAPNPLARDLNEVLAHMGGLWEELRGARVFITGGTGFFGCWLLETFLWANDRLGLDASAVVLTRDPAAFRAKAPHLAMHTAVTLHEGDVRSFAFPEGAFTHVVHAGVDTSSGLDRREPHAMFDTIVNGTGRVLELARRAGTRRFLLTSSGAVYGRQPVDLTHVDEEYAGGPSPTDAASVYGEGKRASEMLCAVSATTSLQPAIARCFTFVGPYLPLDRHFAIGNFIRDGLRGDPIRVTGDGTPYRSYLYASELATWLWTILLRGRPMRPYNVGSAEALSIRQLACRVAGRFATPVDIAAQVAGAASMERYVPAVTRATDELGLRVTVPLDEALDRTIHWHRHVVGSHGRTSDRTFSEKD